MIHDFRIGEAVYLYSESLQEVVEAVIEGFEGEKRLRVKALQRTPDGFIRHIVSWVYVFRSLSEARNAAEEAERQKRDEENLYPRGVPNILYLSGMTVLLRQSGNLVCDKEGNPYLYQIIKVHRNSQKVSLVNAQGENIGTFPYAEVEFHSHEPLFRASDYYIGQLVSWIEGEDVYEGVVTNLHDSTAEVSNVKKLYPLDHKRRLPYYKLIEEDLPARTGNMILTSIVGDNIEE